MAMQFSSKRQNTNTVQGRLRLRLQTALVLVLETARQYHASALDEDQKLTYNFMGEQLFSWLLLIAYCKRFEKHLTNRQVVNINITNGVDG
jgi:hypothetical protein